MASNRIGNFDGEFSGPWHPLEFNVRARSIRLACVVAVAVVAAAAVDRQRPLYRSESNFDRDTEGWTVSGSGVDRGTEPRHRTPPSGSGGWLNFSDVDRGASRIDIAFVVDTTGSMQPSIDDVRAKVKRILGELRQRTNDVRVGLVRFTDEDHDGINAIQPFDLSDDIEARMNTMAGWNASGGGDGPEDQYLGILAALKFSWRRDQPDVIHAIVVISDNPPKPRKRFDRVRHSLPDDISINTIIVATEKADVIEKTRLAAEELAALTSGHVYSADDSDEVAEQILASVEHVIERADPWTWVCPQPLVNHARRSYGETLSYQIRILGSDDYFEATDVMLVGNPTLVYRTYIRPTYHWTQFDVPLYESALWSNTQTRRAATRNEFERSLKTLEAIKIRGEYTTGADLGEIRNVRIAPTQPHPFLLRLAAPTTKGDIK